VRPAAAEIHRAVLRHQRLPPADRVVRVGDVHRAEARPRVRQSPAAAAAAAVVVAPPLLAVQRCVAVVHHDVRVALDGHTLTVSGQQTSTGGQLEHH